jgi:hypothetical protein
VWFFVFSKEPPVLGISKNSDSKELAGFWYLKHSRIKEPSVLGI